MRSKTRFVLAWAAVVVLFWAGVAAQVLLDWPVVLVLFAPFVLALSIGYLGLLLSSFWDLMGWRCDD